MVGATLAPEVARQEMANKVSEAQELARVWLGEAGPDGRPLRDLILHFMDEGVLAEVASKALTDLLVHNQLRLSDDQLIALVPEGQ